MKWIVLATCIVLLSGCEYLEVDKCLDQGGRWDYQAKKCEFEDSQTINGGNS